jgi:hypothetical protein
MAVASALNSQSGVIDKPPLRHRRPSGRHVTNRALIGADEAQLAASVFLHWVSFQVL